MNPSVSRSGLAHGLETHQAFLVNPQQLQPLALGMPCGSLIYLETVCGDHFSCLEDRPNAEPFIINSRVLCKEYLKSIVRLFVSKSQVQTSDPGKPVQMGRNKAFARAPPELVAGYENLANEVGRAWHDVPRVPVGPGMMIGFPGAHQNMFSLS